MLTCVIPGCNSSSKNCRLSFFEIPVKLNVRQKWIEVINNLSEYPVLKFLIFFTS